MRIAMVANAASTHTQRWSRSMAEHGHTVTVLSVRHHPIEGVEVVSTAPVSRRPESKPTIAMGYVKLHRRIKPVLEAFRPDIVHAHYASTNGYIAALVNTQPTVLTVWGTDVVAKPGKSLSPAQRHRVRRAVRHANVVTSASMFMADHVRNVAAPSRLEIIPFGVDLDRFAPVPTPSSRTVLVAKSLEPRYGIEFVIEAMELVNRSIPDARLVIAGDGSLRTKLERIADSSSASVLFRGRVQHDNLASEIASADLVVNPTIVAESFGVVVLEAQAVGRPVVATRVGAVPTVCIEGETAILVDPQDVEAMAGAIVDVLSGSHLTHADTLGPDFVGRHFDWEASVSMMEDLYEEISS